jgi:tetratricopeptide (TPR) repeat protein
MCNLCGKIFRKEKKSAPASAPPPRGAGVGVAQTTGPRPETIEGLDALGWHERGLECVKNNQAAAALECYDKAIAIAPRFAKAWANKATLFHITGRAAEAMQCALTTLSIDPLYMACWYTKAVIEYSSKQYPRAMRSFSEVLTFPIDVDEYALQQAQAAMQSLQQGGVQPADREALGWAAEGTLRGRQGQFDRAVPCFEKALALDPGLAIAWHYKSCGLLRLQRFEDALACDDQAIALDPQHAEHWHQKGVTLKHLRRYEEALACYDRALEIEKRNPAYWSDRGLVLGSLGRDQEAITSLENAIALAPQAAAPWLNKALSEETLQRNEEAIKSYQRFLELASPDLLSHIQHANLRMEALRAKIGAASPAAASSGGPSAARQGAEGQSVLLMGEVSGDRPALSEEGDLLERARSLEQAGHYEEAIDCIDQTLAREPGKESAWYTRGCCLQQLGELEEAVASFDRSIELDPEKPEAWYHKGVCEQISGEGTQAGRSLQRFLSLSNEKEHRALVEDAQHRLGKLGAGAAT